jgi:hypothetical protein
MISEDSGSGYLGSSPCLPAKKIQTPAGGLSEAPVFVCARYNHRMSLAFHGVPPMWVLYLFGAVFIGLLVAIVCALIWRFRVIERLKGK